MSTSINYGFGYSAKSSAVANYSNATASWTTIATISSYLVTGRDVLIMLQSDGTQTGSVDGWVQHESGANEAQVKIVRDSTDIAFFRLTNLQVLPSSAFAIIDDNPGSSGTVTYTIQGQCTAGSNTMRVRNSILVARTFG
jgi:hypothetical protein